MSSGYEADGTLILDQPVALPDVLDILIVGGGPAGTSAAFRAKELGLQALVIDFDDILKRIRDYPKDKLILPSFGGGDKMAFPAGGELVESLHFTDIDKDDICARWKELYRSLGVPARIGVELTGLELGGDGAWDVKTWNHRTQEAQSYRARHVVLALGRGVPRRFDIPGDTDGVAYRLDDPARYVEGPICVVGGGTSAAEAVISISGAKAQAGDECPVYWSYRGSKMPRVSKALADIFFEAYVGAGNIRYFPHSEPVAVVTGPDRLDYLSIRVDRKNVPDRPQESTHLEFLKTKCIACIGDDIPEAFLNSLGIEMAAKAAGDKKKMMLVTPLLETQQPNVYLIGDLLSQAYLETDSFEGGRDTFRQVKHRGNIKASLRDGVFIAEVIQQRLSGRAQVDVVIRDAAPPEEGAGVTLVDALSVGSAAPADAPAIPAGALDDPEAGRLVRITAAGIEEHEYPLHRHGVTTLGRGGTDLAFPDDVALADHHASITHREDGYYLRDDGSRSGTFLKIRAGASRRLRSGGLIRAGQQILVLGRRGEGYELHHFDAHGKLQNRLAMKEGTTVFGRSGGKSNPDVILDDADHTLSRFHFSITLQDGIVTVQDFNSRNGTYLRVVEGEKLADGDLFRVGNQLFRMQIGETLPMKTGSMPTIVVPKVEEPAPAAAMSPPAASAPSQAAQPAPPDAPAAEAAPASATGPAMVTFLGQDIEVPIDPAESILEIADEHDVTIDYECWMGMCGCDVVRVVEGQEHLDEPSEKEIKTLKRKGLEPGPYRLACVTHARGSVTVEVVD